MARITVLHERRFPMETGLVHFPPGQQRAGATLTGVWYCSASCNQDQDSTSGSPSSNPHCRTRL